MTTSAQASVVDRLVGVIPREYRVELSRFARRLRDRLPPVMLAHRIDALERHVDRRIRELEGKVDRVLEQTASKRS